jgi:hypothetical protein
MTERQAAYAFVDVALKGVGIAWSIYPDSAPDETAPPYVVYGGTALPEPLSNGRERKWSEFVFTVRAVDRGNVSSVDAIEDQVSAALDGKFRVVQNGYLIDSVRQALASSVSPRNRQNYSYAGGRFSVTVRKTITN